MWVGGERYAPATLPQGKGPGTHCIGGSVQTGAENLDSTFFLSPDPSALSESLFRLRYPGPQSENVGIFITWSDCKNFGHSELSPLRVLIGHTPYNPPTKNHILTFVILALA